MREVVVALGLIEQGDNYLLQLRGNNPRIGGAGLIGCFGGKLEENETPRQTAARELAEETNLEPMETDFTELGTVEVISDHKLEEVKVTGHLFRIVIDTNLKVEAREGKLVKISKGEEDSYLDRMTTGTRASFEQYILGG